MAINAQTSVGGGRIERGLNENIPIYEGMENWDNWNDELNIAWTKIPAPVSRWNTVSTQSTMKIGHSNSPVSTSSRRNEHSSRATRHKLGERGRQRSVTRLQLSVPKASQDAMTSSQLTQASSTSTNIELRPTLRRAATISPVRRRNDMKDGVEQLPNGQLANSSGFASAGSIVACQEDTTQMNGRQATPNMGGDNGQRCKTNGLPPPVDVQAYPLVSNLRKGLNRMGHSFTDDDLEEPDIKLNGKGCERKVRLLSPSKFLLGRVASNEDICIETETPFTLTIAATDDEICITKVGSSNDLKQNTGARALESQHGGNLYKQKRTVPVSLRLTFGSETSLAEKVNGQQSHQSDIHYQAKYPTDLPGTHQHPSATWTKRSDASNPFRFSLPCISYQDDQLRLVELKP